MLALDHRLGPFLWQFPPNFKFDELRFDAFFDLLPRDTHAAAKIARGRSDRMKGRSLIPNIPKRPLRHAIEFRHESFCVPAFVRLCRKHNVAVVIADTAQIHPYTEDVTADFIYLRLHGAEEIYASGYSPADLRHWADRIAAWRTGREPTDAKKIVDVKPRARKSRDVYVYFDNDKKVLAPPNAVDLAKLLATPG